MRAVENHPRLRELIEVFRKRHLEVVKQVAGDHIAPLDDKFIGFGVRTFEQDDSKTGRRLLSTLNKEKLPRILGYNTKFNTCRPSQTPGYAR